jgi:trk system potassium uptake protein TrkH
VKIGGVLRGVLPRSSALRASGGGARGSRFHAPCFLAELEYGLAYRAKHGKLYGNWKHQEAMKNIIHSLALVGSLIGTSFLICAGVAFLCDDPGTVRTLFLAMGFACLAGSAVAWFFSRTNIELKRRDAIATIVFSWLFCGLIGAVPYLVLGTCADPASAIFESFSGFTTTGASVLTGLEALPRSVLFWRSLTHFLGGVGILIMFIAILPFIGAGGVQLYKAETTGFMGEKLTARIAGTARIIVGIYLLLNVLCALALKFAGLSWYDAVCHAFGTIATGGFSTRTDSIAAFHSPRVEWIIAAFMFVSGINFVAHYRALKGEPGYYFKSSEIRLFASLCAGTILVSTLLLLQRFGGGVADTLRAAAFQTISLFSTTGFTTTDYDLWPAAIKIAFLALMVFGACTGSTSGAIKSARIVVAWKLVVRQLRIFMQPSVALAVKYDGAIVDDDRALKTIGYICAYVVALVIATLLLSLYTPDFMTAASSAIACLGGVGPGMSAAGPTETFAHFPAVAKMVLVACMLLGRLEIYACLVVFYPSFWRK